MFQNSEVAAVETKKSVRFNESSGDFSKTFPEEKFKPEFAKEEISNLVYKLQNCLPGIDIQRIAMGPDESDTLEEFEAVQKKKQSRTMKALQKMSVVPKAAHCVDVSLQANTGVVDFLLSQVHQYDQIRNTLLSRIDQMNAALEAKELQVTSLNTDNHQKMSLMQELTESLHQERTKYEAYVMDAKARLTDLKHQLTEARGKNSSMTSRMHGLEKRVMECDIKIKDGREVKEEKEFIINELEGKIAEVTKQVETKSRQLRDKQTALKASEEEKRQMVAKVAALNGTLTEKETALRENAVVINEKENALTKAKDKAQSLESKISNLIEDNSRIERELHSKIADFNTLSTTVEETNNECSSLREELKVLSDQNQEMESNHQNQITEHERVIEEQKDQLSRVSEMTEKFETLIETLQSRDKDLEEMQDKVNLCEGLISKLKAELAQVTESRNKIERELLSNKKRHKSAMTRVMQQLIIANNEKSQLIQEIKEGNKRITPELRQLFCTTEDCIVLDQERNQLMAMNEDLKYRLTYTKHKLDFCEEQINRLQQQADLYRTELAKNSLLDGVAVVFEPMDFDEEMYTNEEGPASSTSASKLLQLATEGEESKSEFSASVAAPAARGGRGGPGAGGQMGDESPPAPQSTHSQPIYNNPQQQQSNRSHHRNNHMATMVGGGALSDGDYYSTSSRNDSMQLGGGAPLSHRYSNSPPRDSQIIQRRTFAKTGRGTGGGGAIGGADLAEGGRNVMELSDDDDTATDGGGGGGGTTRDTLTNSCSSTSRRHHRRTNSRTNSHKGDYEHGRGEGVGSKVSR